MVPEVVPPGRVPVLESWTGSPLKKRWVDWAVMTSVGAGDGRVASWGVVACGVVGRERGGSLGARETRRPTGGREVEEVAILEDILDGLVGMGWVGWTIKQSGDQTSER